jgi:hypothetical protein
MALKHFVRVNGKGIDSRNIVGYWELQSGDTAAPLVVPRSSDKSVQIHGSSNGGSFGGATVTLKNSNDADAIVYATAYDVFDANIEATSDSKVFTLLPNSYLLKPTISGGNGSTLVRVSLTAHGE